MHKNADPAKAALFFSHHYFRPSAQYLREQWRAGVKNLPKLQIILQLVQRIL